MAVFKNELQLDTSSFSSSLKKAAADSKTSADQITKSLNIQADVDTKQAETSLKSLADTAKTASTSIGSQLKEGLTGSLSGIGGAITGGLVGGGVAAGVQAAAGKIVEGFQFVIDKGSEFQTNLANLSAITGVSGADLDNFGDKAKELAAKFGGDATSQLGAFQGVLSKFGPQLADTPESLNQVTENINLLAKAAGLDAAASMDSLTTSMLQFGIDASDPARLAAESGRFINVLAASAKEGAAEIPQVAEAVRQAGVAASGANISFEETNAAIQALAIGGKVGSEAGIGLRNVIGGLVKTSGPGAEALASVGLSIDGLGKTLTEKGLSAALTELQSGVNKFATDAEKAAFMATLFGTENASSAGILLKNASTIQDLTTKITGTSEATRQAEVNMATFSEFMSRVSATISNAAISIFQGFSKAFSLIGELTSGTVGPAIESISGYFERMWSVVEPILMIIGGAIIAGIVTTINVAATAIDVAYNIMIQAFDAIKGALMPLVDTFLSVFGLDGATGKSIDVMQIFKDALSTVGSVLSGIGDVLKLVGGFIIELLITPINIAVSIFSSLVKGISAAIDWFKEFIGINKETSKQVENTGGFIEWLRGAFNNIKGTIGGVTEAFKEIKIVISEFFVALTNFNIGEALEKLTKIGERVGKAYNAGFNKATDQFQPKVPDAQAPAGGGKTQPPPVKTPPPPPPPPPPKGKAAKETNEETSALKKAEEALKDYDEQLKNARNTEEARLKNLLLTNEITETQYKVQIAEFDKAQIESRIQKAAELLQISATNLQGVGIDSTLKLNKDETKKDVLDLYEKLRTDSELKKVNLELSIKPKEEKKASIFKQLQRIYSKDVLFREILAAGFGIKIPVNVGTPDPKQQDILNTSLTGLLNNTVNAVKAIDWNKVFERPAKASEEAVNKIVTGITDGVTSYQDGIDELAENLKRLPSVFDAVREQLNVTFKQITQDNINSLAQTTEAFLKGTKTAGDFYTALATTAGSAFAQILTEQEDYGKASLLIALNALEALVPILVAEIIGKALATNPILGAAVGAVATAALLGLVAAAKASVSGFAEGGYTGDGAKYAPAGIVHKGEFVINKENTRRYRGILEQMNEGKFPLSVQTPVISTALSGEMSGMRQELAAIRKRLDSMPNGIQGQMAVAVDVGMDTYLYERNRYRMAVRGLRG